MVKKHTINPRRRAASELTVVGLLAFCFLLLFPQRAMTVDMGLAVFASVLIGLNARFTKAYMWDRVPPEIEKRRWTRCSAITLFLTSGAVVLFLTWGIFIGYREGGWAAAGDRILDGNLLQAFLLFLPWAFLQQTLLQFYLLGRLRTLWPSLSPLALSALNGLAFGLVHLPDLGVAFLTALGGTAWSFLYHRYRLLLPLAGSHAVLGATLFTWVYGRSPAETFWGQMS